VVAATGVLLFVLVLCCVWMVVFKEGPLLSAGEAPAAAVHLVSTHSGKEIFERVLRSVKAPASPVVWKKTGNERVHLCCAIVEPRRLDLFRHSVWNMAHVYGNRDDVSLFVFHGTDNEQYVRDAIEGWENVELVNLNVQQLVYPDGVNELLMDTKRFWSHLKVCEFALLFQADSIIRRAIPPELFQFSFVGGPWIRKNAMRPDRLVGNGGFSLRKVDRMIEILDADSTRGKWEDQFVVSQLKDEEIAPLYLARQFSDNLFHPDPVGLHQPYSVIPKLFVAKMLFHIPGSEDF
jgi:hypothetical protein